VFFEQGADMALRFLGHAQRHLIGDVFLRAKYLERCAKRAAPFVMQEPPELGADALLKAAREQDEEHLTDMRTAPIG
jgi:hypothetical protein